MAVVIINYSSGGLLSTLLHMFYICHFNFFYRSCVWKMIISLLHSQSFI